MSLEFQPGYAVVARRGERNILKGFYWQEMFACEAKARMIDLDPLSVELAEICYAANGNVRIWKLRSVTHQH